MNNKFVLCMVILANVVFSVKCQEISFDSIYSRIDTTRLSTNILYNSIFPLTKTRYTEFSGLEDTISIAGSEWKQLYSELYYAHLKSRTIPSYMTMYDSATLIVKQGKIPIGIINLKYNLIKENAFDDDLLQHDGLYVIDGNNQSENPYTENRCFTACVISDTIRSLSASFFLDDNLVFTENNEQIQFYEINFDDGNGYINIEPNNSYDVEYASIGKKTISIEAHLYNSEILYSKSKIIVQEPSSNTSPEPDQILPISGIYLCREFTGTYGIWYGCNNNGQLKKPIIFVEGIDPENTNVLKGEGKLLYDIANQQSLLNNLHDNGFDIVILNFDNGGALIQGNAMILRKLIDEINENKKTDNELVIIGGSMGGLVARYALSYMENKNENHKTRLFISLDTPHQGAYIPLSIQHLFKQVHQFGYYSWLAGVDIFPYIQSIDNKINCKAARQMLVYHYESTNNNQANPDPLRTAFIAELNSLTTDGYPQHCRKIAISEGSGNSILQNINPISSYVDISADEDTFCIRDVTFTLDLHMKPLTDHQPVNVLKFNMSIGVDLGGGCYGWASFGPICNIDVTVNNTKPYDFAPGGYYDIMSSFLNPLGDVLGLDLNYSDMGCFMPTMSALDIRCSDSLDYNIRSHILTNNQNSIEINDQSKTPFDAIYVEEMNKVHITDDGITELMAQFIFNEISKDTLIFIDKEMSGQVIQYEATNTIIAGDENANALGKKVEIKENSNITFVAGNNIILKPGFSVESGSVFHAYINDFTCFTPINYSAPSMLRNYFGNSSNSQDLGSKGAIEIIRKKNNVRISPNPSNGMFRFNVEMEDYTNGKVQISNIFGQLIYEDVIEANLDKSICLPRMPGLYILKVFSNNKLIHTDKIIVK